MELSLALRREIHETVHGHTDILISLPFFLPSSIRLRRRYSPRSYGPLGLLWWPYRYRGGFVRFLWNEGAQWVVTAGVLGLGILLCTNAATPAS